jgi:hypothetical protein
MSNEDLVKATYPTAHIQIDPYGIQYEVAIEDGSYIDVIDGKIYRPPKVLGTSQNSIEEAWTMAWRGVQELMIKKLEE